MRKNAIVNIDIDKLTPYSEQGNVFLDLDDFSLRDLADDIQKNGLLTPIEITSKNSIICGHQRVRACKLLKQKTIEAVVRRDLEDDGEDAIRRRFLEDNLNRRQMSKLETARCFRELKKCGPERRSEYCIQGDLRDFLAKRFGVSGKTLERWVKILDAPIEIQKAFEEDSITQQQALAFLKFDEGIQQDVLHRMSAGENLKDVIKEFLNMQQTAPIQIETALRRLAQAMKLAQKEILPRTQKLLHRKNRHFRKGIIEFIEFLQGIVTLIPEVEPSEEDTGELQELLNKL